MPDWEPNWQDVRWDHAAAQEAIVALRHAADLLDRTADDRARMAREAQEQWRGRYREEFDAQLEQILRGARDLAGQYRHAANEIARADQRAYDEQRHRERERGRWRMEKESEERARLQQGENRGMQ